LPAKSASYLGEKTATDEHGRRLPHSAGDDPGFSQGTMTPEEMRDRARQCEQIAQQVSDFGAQEIYERPAQKWHHDV
jgi:hypothetical protein